MVGLVPTTHRASNACVAIDPRDKPEDEHLCRSGAQQKSKPMSTLDIIPGSRGFVRKGGREGGWLPEEMHHDPDDVVVSPFDFVIATGADAENALFELKRVHPRSTPVLMGSPHEAALIFERMHRWDETPTDWLSQADALDLDVWLADRKSKHEQSCLKYGESWPRRGEWPDSARVFDRLLVPDELLKPGEKKPQVIIGLLPTADPTEAAAYLAFGGWNDCPRPPIHVAFSRLWHEKYGAVLQSNTFETVEFRVARPVKDRQEALKLALDQYHYCTDSIPETLEVAAAELIGATVWCFWWD